MTEYIFLGLLLVIAILDYVNKRIENFIILPAIIIGLLLTKNWQAVLVMLGLSASIFGYHWKCSKCGFEEKHWTPFSFWRGGDVKLMCFVGAFLGMKAIIIFLLTLLLIYLYRFIFKRLQTLPVSPFSFVAVLLLNIYSVTIGTRC